MNLIYPEFEVARNTERCTKCGICVKQCPNGVHALKVDPTTGEQKLAADDSRCVDCQRCVVFCPVRALKIVKSGNVYRENAYWAQKTINEIHLQAEHSGVLLSSMGSPEPYPVYFDRILLNASQVTNPPIDPLREPMETRVSLGAKPKTIERDPAGRIVNNLGPQIELSLPVMFSAMSYGSISLNAHESLARAAEELGIMYNAGEGACTKVCTNTAGTPLYRLPQEGSACTRIILTVGRRSRSKWGREPSRGSAVICREPKSAQTSPAPG